MLLLLPYSLLGLANFVYRRHDATVRSARRTEPEDGLGFGHLHVQAGRQVQVLHRLWNQLLRVHGHAPPDLLSSLRSLPWSLTRRVPGATLLVPMAMGWATRGAERRAGRREWATRGCLPAPSRAAAP